MDNAKFSINAEEPVFIYGGGIFGVGCANLMIAAGYNVRGIIDINPGGVNDPPVPVITPEEASETFNGSFIWIGLANGESHPPIALKLSRLGFERILFLPLFIDSKTAKSMAAAYNAFCIGNYTVDIPLYADLWKVRADDYFLTENSGFVTVRIHKNHFYITDKFSKMTDNPYSLYKTLIPYISIMPQIPLVDFIDFYMQRFQNARRGLYIFFERALYTNPDYFTDYPCVCSLNEHGYWDLLDGHHRASFLITKGYIAIPARARREEYVRYFREDAAQELMDCYLEAGALPYETEHPAFFRLPVDNSIITTKFGPIYEKLFGGHKFEKQVFEP